MNWLDIVLAAIFAFSIVAGFRKGLTRTLLNFASVVLGLLLAVWLYGSVGSIFADYVAHRMIANAIGFIVVYALVSLAGFLVGYAMVKFYKAVGLNWLDRLLGGGLGFVRGFLAGSILVMALMGFSRNPPPQSVTGSAIAPYMAPLASALSWLAPRELRDNVSKSYDKVKELWKKAVERGQKALPTQSL